MSRLEALLRSGKTEQRTARRARILLGMHQGERVNPLSEKVEQDASTIWRVCRRYEERGVEWRYWKTTLWDAEAIRRAAKVLWCYEGVSWLLERGILIACVDEKPNLQVLERAGPIRPMIPAHIEQQEFEYIRHGTVDLLAGMTVHDGDMWAECLETNDGAH